MVGGVRVCACIPPRAGDSLRTMFKRPASSFLWISGIKPRSSGVIAVPPWMALCIVFIILCVWLPFRDLQSGGEEHCTSFWVTDPSMQKRKQLLYLRRALVLRATKKPNGWSGWGTSEGAITVQLWES